MSQQTTILYIEDDPGSQRLVKRLLESHDYRVLVASDGLDGIALALQETPNLILVDINLPHLDGQEISTRLRGMPRFAHTPIIALTANNSPGAREQALVAGCTAFLTKPIDVNQFPQQVADFLSGRSELLSANERSAYLEQYAQRLVGRLEGKIQELREANNKLRELDRLKNDFIVLVSHELRTPLTLISGYVYLLKEKAGKETAELSNKEARHIADGLSLGVERLSGVINEVISVSRITSGTLDLAIGPVQLALLVQRIVKEIEPICAKRSLQLTVADLSHLPIIEGDGTQLRTAISNVVGNAIKYTPDGGQITILADVIADTINLKVQDTGFGIPPEQQRQIFEQFHVLGSIQHHSTSKSAFQGGGLGLGLAIAKGIIEAHEGRIWVESRGYDPQNPPGSIFHILLPIRQAQI
jgi:signal transduction histidine kinase